MRDVTRLAKVYIRAYQLANGLTEGMPEAFEALGKDLVNMASSGAPGARERAEADLHRFVAEVWAPFVQLLDRQLKRTHKDIVRLLRMRIATSEFLHTLASEQGRYELTANLGTEIEKLRGILVDDLLGEIQDGEET